MIRSLILYYLNIKPTHGYEIQKFLQVSGIDQWTTIQSGSIYYALTKLEKENCVKVLREEKNGARIRKIYAITENGKKELQRGLQKELSLPIMPVGADKFLVQSIFDALPRDIIIIALKKHLSELLDQKNYWKKWRQIKTDHGNVNNAEKIAFDMTIENLKYQILWHEEILNNVDQYVNLSKETRKLIESIDFSAVNEDDTAAPVNVNPLPDIQKLCEEIINNPENALENIDRLIKQLKQK